MGEHVVIEVNGVRAVLGSVRHWLTTRAILSCGSSSNSAPQ